MERLAKVAHMYYEEDRTQGEIASAMQVSRPLVSRMLREAREMGIVEIRVHQPACDTRVLLTHLCQQYGLQGGALIAEETNYSLMDYNMAKQLLQHIETEQPTRLGIGWGTMIGALTSLLECMPPRQTAIQTVCPLIGNSSVSSRHYHTDENVRIVASGLCAQPKFLYTPAFAENKEEYQLLCDTSHYRSISEQWDQLDMAVIGIHEPSIVLDEEHPLRQDQAAAGRMIAYGFDSNGRTLRPDTDCAIRIPLDKLTSCRQVIGVCAADVSPGALQSALRTDLLTHVFARESLADAVMTDRWNYA